MRKVSISLISLLTVAFLLIGCSTTTSSPATSNNETIVQTADGNVQGKLEDGVLKYLGVPFAQPPTGNLRFAPPQPVAAWEGELDCTAYRDSAVQAVQDESLTYSEDCLYLNIWAPEKVEKAEKLPVYVFIHGGAFVVGSPSDPHYDGTAFAKDGIIQVNVTYRMSALGFFSGAETEEAYGYTGNIGLLDQVAALQWVQDNIAAFGGDPNNVTIGGESAGAFSVSNLIESPLAKGLFQRGILESGNLLGQQIIMPLTSGDKQQAYDLGEQFLAKMNAKSLNDLRGKDAQELVNASVFSKNVIEPYPYCFWPVFDGKALPEDPYKALTSGQVNDVDILAGFNTDEGEGFVPEGISEQQYAEFVTRIFGTDAEKVLARFPVDEQHSATDRARDIVKIGLRIGSEAFGDELSARGKNVYYYNYDYVPATVAAQGSGAIHAMELYFVFGNARELDNSSETAAVMDDIRARWANFIKTGDPNQGAAVSTTWETYDSKDKQTLVIGEKSEMERVPDEADAAFYRELLFGEAN